MNSEASPEKEARSRVLLNAPAARILVLNDEPLAVDMLVTCLREESYGPVGAETSAEGSKHDILSRPEMVLVEIWGYLKMRPRHGGKVDRE